MGVQGGGGAIGGTNGRVQYSIVGGKQGEVVRSLGKEISGREQQWIDCRDVSEEADKVISGAATTTVMETSTEARTTT